MCCIMYYIYRKCRYYFKRKDDNTNSPEVLYTASMLDNHVKSKRLSAVWEV